MLAFTDDTAPHQIAFASYGSELRACASSAEILARIEMLLPPGWRPCASTLLQKRLGILVEDDGSCSVYHGGARVSEGQGLELSLMVLDGELRAYIALNAPDMMFVHAGAVGHEGRAMIFPAHSFAGKTTLVAALVRAGAVYYSDEFAVLDAEGLVHPYPKPLSVRSDPPTSPMETPVELLGGVPGEEPLPLGLAVFTHYRPGAEWRPKQISSGQAALALLSNTMGARARAGSSLRSISRALDDCIALEGERGEATEIVDRLLAAVHAY